MNKKLRDRFQAGQDKLDHEQEEARGDYGKMKAVFEKKIQLYNRFLTEDDLTEVDRLMLLNKREWIMSHMLSLIIEDQNTAKFGELTKRVYELEKKVSRLEEQTSDRGDSPEGNNNN